MTQQTKERIFFIIVSAIISIFSLLAYRHINATTTDYLPALTTVKEINCILKTDNGVWSVLDNSAHDNNGCGAVTQTSTYIKIEHDQLNTVIGGYVEEDNYMNALDIVAGASVGFTYSYIQLHKDGVIVDPGTVTGSYTNLFVEFKGFVY